MEKLNGWLLAEIGFYVALGALLVLFFIKKYRQARNVEKEKLNNKP